MPEDIVSAADLLGVGVNGVDAGIDGLQFIATETAGLLLRWGAKLRITLEYKRMGALQGKVLNADDSTSLANLSVTCAMKIPRMGDMQFCILSIKFTQLLSQLIPKCLSVVPVANLRFWFHWPKA